MQSKKTTNRLFKSRSGKKLHGFTLAELIVVLAILAILSAVGVVVAVGFINKSKFDQNSQNAITVYQAAQTALSHKIDDGSIEEWITVTFAESGFQPSDFKVNGEDVLKETNESIHKTVHLTYDPDKKHPDSEKLQDLLGPYFYDRTVFAGTISVVFDLSATRQNDGSIHFSAMVLSAFYSKENVAPASGGWDRKCTNKSEDQALSSDDLPEEDYDYRHDTSYVGFFNGTDASLAGPVALPAVLDSTPAAEVTLRNGETLDISWVILGDHSKTDDIFINLYNADALAVLSGSSSFMKPASLATIKIEGGESAIDIAANTKQPKEYEYIKKQVNGLDSAYSIEKTVKTGIITIKVSNNGGEFVEHTFPVTVSEVYGDGRQEIIPYADFTKGENYTTYTLSIDCMMVREQYTSLNEYNKKTYTTNVLFGAGSIKNYDPQNICATLVTGNNSNNDYYVATRAIDDPVHFEGVEQRSFRDGNQTAITYNLDDGNRAALDTEGGCVVNTLFGDLVCYDGDVTYNGSFASSSGGDAVITSFRHLSNIRMTSVGNFHIARDLNWYWDETGMRPISEVKVYSLSTGKYNSPVLKSDKNNPIRVVSFPAITELSANQSLSALHRSDDPNQLYSINYLQMRKASFYYNNNNKAESDEGYALICKNNGRVFNIVTNNLNLVMKAVGDGSKNDYSSINKTSIVSDSAENRQLGDEKKPVGGLIGINNGYVGVADDSVITMSNTVIMASSYWKIQKYFGGTGAVIGSNSGENASVNGQIEINGTYAIVSHTYVGGIIGYSSKDIGAKLLVNKSDAPSGIFQFSADSKYGAVSSVVMGWNSSGGAVGAIEGGTFTYSVSNSFNGISALDETGNFTFNGYDQYDYQIDVELPQNSLILQLAKGAHKDDYPRMRGAGGAVGYMRNCNSNSSEEGNYLSIQVLNNGRIVSTNDVENYYTEKNNIYYEPIYCGGAVGRDENSKISTAFVHVVNGNDTKIGYLSNNQGPHYYSAGGAYGQIDGKDRTVAIYVENNGTSISARGDLEHLGVGGAIGCTSTDDVPRFIIKAINKSTSITDTFNKDAITDGAGGAIGSISRDKLITADSVIYVENTNTTISGYNYVGGAIGDCPANNGKIFVVNDNATITGVDSTDYVGGAIGRITGDGSNGVVKVTSKNDTKISGGYYVGGVIGLNDSVLGSVSLNGSDSGSVTGAGEFVGGAIGHNNKPVSGSIDVVSASAITGGDKYVGGAIGRNDAVVGSISVDCSGKIQGNAGYVGGAIGYNASEVQGDINVTKLSGVAGQGNYVGGAIGHNNAIVRGNVSVVSLGEITSETGNFVGGAIGYNYATVNKIDVKLNANTRVAGGDYTAGGIGHNLADVSEGISVAFTDSSVLIGKNYTGGAVGFAEKGNLYKVSATYSGNRDNNPVITGTIYVGGVIGQLGIESETGPVVNEISADISVSSFISQNSGVDADTDAYVGGLIGWIPSNNTIDKITLSSSSGSSNVYKITANGNSIGGMIGQIGIPAGTVAVKITEIDTSSSPKISVECPEGNSGIGGWIGKSYYSWAGSATSTTLKVTNIDSVISNADGVGGFCGILVNPTDISNTLYADLEVDISDADIEGYDEVGGLIGYMNNIDYLKITSLKMSGLSVDGNANVGGLIGYIDDCSISDNLLPDTSNFTTASNVSVSGNGDDVGGLIGELEVAEDFYLGDLIISASNFDISGDNHVGGVIGNVTLDSNYLHGKVSLNLYSSSSVEGSDCVGAVFGNWNDGNFADDMTIMLSNSSIDGANYVAGAIGLWKEGTFDGGITAAYNNVELAATGNYVGGIIGRWTDGDFAGGITADFTSFEITEPGAHTGGIFGEWHEGDFEGGINAVFKASEIESTGSYVGGIIGLWTDGDFDGGITAVFDHTSVVSTGDNVAGAIGKWCDGTFAGGVSINAQAKDVNKYQNFTVSGSAMVGGAVGELSGGYLYGPIVISLRNSFILGSEEVGGAIGILDGGVFSGGYDESSKDYCGIDLYFANNTYLGDDPAASSDSWRCIDIGGAIGYVGAYDFYEANSGRICIEFDGTSQIFAGGTTDRTDVGVGGAFGRLGEEGANSIPYVNTWDNKNDVISEISSSPDQSFKSLDSSQDSLANVEVICRGNNITIESRGSNVGGLAGHMFSGILVRSFSTAIIKGVDYVGGVVGHMEGGRIAQCYSGGHTVGGQYISGSENIIGERYVGGFAGYVESTAGDMYQCYTTSSVRGSACVGGFIGYNERNEGGFATCNTCYCTGLVSLKSGGDSDTVGAYAGYSEHQGCYSGKYPNKVLNYVNDPDVRRVGYVKYDLSGKLVKNPVSEGNMPVNARIIWANWGTPPAGADKNSYIRIDPNSVYSVENFDEALNPYDKDFPLRTFISFRDKTMGNKWNGFHYGDWPKVMTASTKLLSDSTTTVIFVDKDGNQLPDDYEFEYEIGSHGICPDILVYYKDELIPQDMGYITINYSNNQSAGVATIMISGNGMDYGRAVTKTFKIKTLDITGAEVKLDIPEGGYTYDGNDKIPGITVTYGEGENAKTIPADDYTVTYTDCVNAGQVTITITPDTSKYKMSEPLTATYEIAKATIDPGNLDVSLSGTEDSSEVSVTIKAEGDDVVLTKDIDYTYELNIAESKLTLQIDLDNYAATYTYLVHTVEFKIDDEHSYVTHVVIEGKAVVLPDDPTSEGKVFAGWDWGEVDQNNITENVVILAKWDDQSSGGEDPAQQPGGGENPGEQPGGGEDPAQQPGGGENPALQPGSGEEGTSDPQTDGDQGGDSGNENNGESGSSTDPESGNEEGNNGSGGTDDNNSETP